LGDISTSEGEELRRWASTLAIRELWFREESGTLRGDGISVEVHEGERVADAFRRLLRFEAERQLAKREANRDPQKEAHESIERRFRGKHDRPR
jgi:hypothetical protein